MKQYCNPSATALARYGDQTARRRQTWMEKTLNFSWCSEGCWI